MVCHTQSIVAGVVGLVVSMLQSRGRQSGIGPACSSHLCCTADPNMDLSKVNINKPPTPAAAAGAAGAGDQGKYEATFNTLYIGGLPVEWNNDQVGRARSGF